MYEQKTVRHLYKKLLAFYPRAFREQLEESMEQTFHDLFNEKRQTKSGLFGFVIWAFIETAIGILNEHLLLIKGDSMQNILTNLRLPTTISFLLILPFMIMEVINRRSFNEDFPFPLFIIMWLLPVLRFSLSAIYHYVAPASAIPPHRDADCAKCTGWQQHPRESCNSFDQSRFSDFHRVVLGQSAD